MRTARLKVGLDTSCLVPLFSVEHVFHAPTVMECDRLRRQHTQFVVPCHALLECFSVLTRMPPPFRRSPGAVGRLLQENFSQDAVIPDLSAALAWSCIGEMVSRGAGGKTSDALIALAAFEAGATVLLTWNLQDFLQIAPPGLDVATPAEHAARASRVHR